jgi:hypothetical protein
MNTGSISRRTGEYAGMSFPERVAEFGEEFIPFASPELQKPLERIEHEALNGIDCQSAGCLAASVAAHSISHHEYEAAVVAVLQLGSGQAGVLDFQAFDQPCDQKLVFILCSDFALIG